MCDGTSIFALASECNLGYLGCMTNSDRTFYRRVAIGFAAMLPCVLVATWLLPDLEPWINVSIGWGAGILILLWAHEVFD